MKEFIASLERYVPVLTFLFHPISLWLSLFTQSPFIPYIFSSPLPYSAASKAALPLDIVPSPIPQLSIQYAVLWVVNLLLPPWLARERWIWHRHRHASVFSWTLGPHLSQILLTSRFLHPVHLSRQFVFKYQY